MSIKEIIKTLEEALIDANVVGYLEAQIQISKALVGLEKHEKEIGRLKSINAFHVMREKSILNILESTVKRIKQLE